MDQANALRDRVRLKQVSKVYELGLNRARVITVSSGKGGVGKTNFALNVAINLSNACKKVILIDADFGLANVEVLLGSTPRYTLKDMLTGDKTLDEIILKGPQNINIISGGNGFTELANLSDMQMCYILRSFAFLDNFYDFVIIDTGAGMNNAVTKIVRACHESIIITTPEPTAMSDAISLIRNITFENKSIPDIKIIVNKAEDLDEVNETFFELIKSCREFTNTKFLLLGGIKEDKMLVRAVKKQEPCAILYPNCAFSKATEQISERLLENDIEINDSTYGLLPYVKKLVNIFSLKE